MHFNGSFVNKQQGRLDLSGKPSDFTGVFLFPRCSDVTIFVATVANTYGDIVESDIDKPFWFLIFSPMYVTGNDTQGSEAGEYILGFQ